MFEALDRLSRADEAAAAAPSGFTFLTHRLAAAFRTDMRELERFRILWPPRLHDADDLRDDIAGALDDDGVAFADVLALDFVLIVQGGAADDDAADGDRLELRNRRQRAAPAHLDTDFLEHGLCLLRANLCATAQRGARETKPKRSSRSRSFTL